MMMNVAPAAGTSTAIDSGVNVAYGVIVNGESMALETNMASDVVDTVMEENEANGMAIDSVGIDSRGM